MSCVPIDGRRRPAEQKVLQRAALRLHAWLSPMATVTLLNVTCCHSGRDTLCCSTGHHSAGQVRRSASSRTATLAFVDGRRYRVDFRPLDSATRFAYSSRRYKRHQMGIDYPGTGGRVASRSTIGDGFTLRSQRSNTPGTDIARR